MDPKDFFFKFLYEIGMIFDDQTSKDSEKGLKIYKICPFTPLMAKSPNYFDLLFLTLAFLASYLKKEFWLEQSEQYSLKYL